MWPCHAAEAARRSICCRISMSGYLHGTHRMSWGTKMSGWNCWWRKQKTSTIWGSILQVKGIHHLGVGTMMVMMTMMMSFYRSFPKVAFQTPRPQRALLILLQWLPLSVREHSPLMNPPSCGRPSLPWLNFEPPYRVPYKGYSPPGPRCHAMKWFHSRIWWITYNLLQKPL